MSTNTRESSNDGLGDYVKRFAEWHHARNLINGSTDQAQMLKLVEEIGELAGNVARGKPIADDIGDMLVILTNIAERNGLTLGRCAAEAWMDIKDRKGKMVDGVFVKESDLQEAEAVERMHQQ